MASWTEDGAYLPRVSVVIPALNEAENIPVVMEGLPSIVDEVVVVDGGSVDGTAAVARRIRPDARIVVEPRRGKGRALRTGFENCTGDLIVMIDADGSMDPGEIPVMVAALRAGADVVKGSRFLQGAGTDDMSALRRAGNDGLRLLVRLLFGGRYSDLCYGYMAFWRHALPTFDGEADGFEVETFLNVRALAAGLRVAEVPSFEHDRLTGVSNLNTFRDGWRVLLTIFRERRALSTSRGSHGVARPVPGVGVDARSRYVDVRSRRDPDPMEPTPSVDEDPARSIVDIRRAPVRSAARSTDPLDPSADLRR